MRRPPPGRFLDSSQQLPDLATCKREMAERLERIRVLPTLGLPELTGHFNRVGVDWFTYWHDTQGVPRGGHGEWLCLPDGVVPWPTSR